MRHESEVVALSWVGLSIPFATSAAALARRP